MSSNYQDDLISPAALLHHWPARPGVLLASGPGAGRQLGCA